jgi:hypothetical protein
MRAATYLWQPSPAAAACALWFPNARVMVNPRSGEGSDRGILKTNEINILFVKMKILGVLRDLNEIKGSLDCPCFPITRAPSPRRH